MIDMIETGFGKAYPTRMFTRIQQKKTLEVRQEAQHVNAFVH